MPNDQDMCYDRDRKPVGTFRILMEEEYLMEIMVCLKSVSRRKQSVQPVAYEIKGSPATVRELILAVTEAGVHTYNQKQESPELLPYLVREEIEAKAEAGKISFGAIYGEKQAELSEAQENAIQCFEDGIYRVFLDGKPLEMLDEEIHITKESVFTFVRLTMLAGRMW